MEKLKIVKEIKSKDTITRTIRISGATYDKINELAYENGIKFNNVANQLIEYALKNLDDGKKNQK